MNKFYYIYIFIILGVVKRNPLFLHEIEWKNNGFLFTTANINAEINIVRMKYIFIKKEIK